SSGDTTLSGNSRLRSSNVRYFLSPPSSSSRSITSSRSLSSIIQNLQSHPRQWVDHSDPFYSPQIPPTAVGGLFRSSLQAPASPAVAPRAESAQPKVWRVDPCPVHAPRRPILCAILQSADRLSSAGKSKHTLPRCSARLRRAVKSSSGPSESSFRRIR